MLQQLNIGILTKYTGNFYHGTLIHSINKTLTKYGARTFVINNFMVYRFLHEQEKDLLYGKLAFDYIDGWIILSEGASDKLVEMLCKTGKPVITVGFKAEGVNCGSVLEDSLSCSEAVVQHLIDHGHRKIVYIGCSDIYDMRVRFDGYKRAHEKNSIPMDPNLCIMADIRDINMNPLGKNAIKKLVSDRYEFTAVFAGCDMIALGAVEALKESGLRIPEDVAIIGYDDTIYAKSENLSLSSARQDIYGLGVTAAEAMINSIKEKVLPLTGILVESNLIRRNSCGCREDPNDESGIAPTDGRFKNSVINYLQKEIDRSYGTASDLFLMDIGEIREFVPKIAGSYSVQCIGYWNERNELYIHQIIDENLKPVLDLDKSCPPEAFPPAEFIQYLKESDCEDIIWIIPVTTINQDWCIISYISPYNTMNLLLFYDSSVVLFNIIGIFLDHAFANQKLKNTLETLQHTQEQLIQSEKMVSLGRLVAGVAHEINTPIGVSVTAASFIKDNSNKLIELFESGKLKRSDMEKHQKSISETADILLLNLSKASNLVRSFKQVAVDQSHEEKRRFNVKDYMNEVLLSLNPKLKKTGIIVDISCPDDIEIYDYPGGLSQILTNLVVNSIMHAYKEGENGVISINISAEENEMTFVYSDDGSGIEKANISKIFEPFFTTKRGSGGTGLGLNIVYNVVTQQYGGSIKCESIPGSGSTFIIKIPLKDS